MRVLVAARLSKLVDGQTGLDSQDAESTAWAEREGHTVIHVAADRKSGTSAPWDRKNLRPWVTEPDRLAQYDAIVAYRLDRLSRGDNASTNAIEKWAHDNGKVLLTVDGLRFPCEGKDDIRWDVTKRIAHEEWLGASEKYKRMTTYLRGEGKLSSRPPFGYESVPAPGGHKTLAPTEEGRLLIPEIFSRCKDGESLTSIAEWLNGKGIKLASGKPKLFHSITLSRIIRNTAYIGRVRTVAGKTILRCEALADATTFRLANEKLSQGTKRGPQTDHRAMLTSSLFCLRCGGPMYRVVTGKGYTYYRCAGAGPVATRKSCGASLIPLKALDERVSERIDRMTSTIREARVIPGHDYSAELEEIKLDIRDLANLDLSDDEYDAELRRLRAERDRITSLPTEPDRIEEVDTGVSWAEKWDTLSDSERGGWLRKAGVRIFALKGTQADIDAIAATSGIFGPDDAPPGSSRRCLRVHACVGLPLERPLQ